MPVHIGRFGDFIGPLSVMLLSSLVCGGILGIEREMRHKTAGLKTVVLICVGSALYAGLARLMIADAGGQGDSTRVAGQVITGIGFIGGGTILHAEGMVVGLTSAAVIWVVAGIGLFIGAGYPTLGFAATICVLGMLLLLAAVETHLLHHCEKSMVTIRFADDGGTTRAALTTLLGAHHVDLDSYAFDTHDGESTLRVGVCREHPQHRAFVPELWKLPGVRGVQA